MRRGLGCGGWGEIWWRYRVDAGPDERRRGYEGWNVRDVTADWRLLVEDCTFEFQK